MTTVDPLIDVIARLLHQQGGGKLSPSVYHYDARDLLAAIADSGRLLPEGVLMCTEWGVRVVGGYVIDWPNKHMARVDYADRAKDGHEVTLVHRTKTPAYIGPWEVAS